MSLPVSSRSLSSAQRQMSDVGQSAAVQAGAGAGKTAGLVGRIVNSLESGIAPEQIVSVSFSVFAAQELRQRVRTAVRQRAAQDSDWSSLEEQLPLLGITTIHSLCYRIVTEHPVESGAGLGLAVQDETEWAIYREQHLSRLIAQQPPAMVSAVPRSGRARQLTTLLNDPGAALSASTMTHNDPAAESLASLFCNLDEAFTTQKQADGIANFADLERWAEEALIHDRVRAHYAERIRVLLVDEMQDTSEAQWRILRALVGESTEFVTVGDEQQAIYSFRGGDPASFRIAQHDTAERGGELITLDTNYRSSPRLLAVINGLFAQLFSGTETNPTYRPMQAARQDDVDQPPAELHQVSGGTASSRALAVGRVITSQLQASLGRLVLDRKSGQLRPARWDDMAILIRSRTHLAALRMALQESGIPYHIHGGRGLYDRPEVREAIDLLILLTDPADDITLLAVLKGTYFRWSEQDLYNLVQKRRPGDTLWYTLQVSQDRTAQRAASVLKAWRTRSALYSPGRLLLEADLATGHSVIHAGQEDGAQRLGNIARLHEVLYRWAGEGRGSVGSVAQYCQSVRKLRNTAAYEPEAQAAVTDAVHVLTVHQAKGLEWPIVAYSGAVPSGYMPRPTLRMDPQRGLLLPTSSSWRDAANERAQLEQGEESRLLYVACTRARDHLILVGSVGTTAVARQAAQQLLEAWPSGLPRYLHIAGEVGPTPSLPLVSTPGRLVIQFKPGPSHALPTDISVSGLQRYAVCPRLYAYQDLAGYLPLAGSWMDKPSTLARDIGDGVHRAMERRCNSRR